MAYLDKTGAAHTVAEPRQLYLQWLRFQRRPISMQAFFGFELAFLSTPLNLRILRPLDYLWKAVATLNLVWRRRPEIVWVAGTPVFALQSILAFHLIFRPRPKIVVDCHNAVFYPPWSRMPFVARSLRSADLCLVHNASVVALAKRMGVEASRLVVLEDRPATRAPAVSNAKLPAPRGSYVVFPSGFRSDDPLRIVLAAGRLLAPTPLFITGDYHRMHARSRFAESSAANVHVTGFLEREEFDALLTGAGVVLGLTAREGVQLSVANEAVGFHRPLVLSDTATLRSMFPKGTVFVETADPESIAQGCRAALAAQARLAAEIAELADERDAQWQNEAAAVARRLGLARETSRRPATI